MREMRDSGVEWIGEVPKSWNIRRLKYELSFSKGLSITKADLIDEGISVVSYGQIHSKNNTGVHISDEMIRFVDPAYLESDRASIACKGDIIFADTSEDYDGIGNCVLVDRDEVLFAGYHTIIGSAAEKQASKFLAYLFGTDQWRSQLRSAVSGIKVFSITQKILKSTRVICPPSPRAAAHR